MRLSIIVCTRNRASAIVDCLDAITASLAHAAPLIAEIVVIDNASSDDTSAVVADWAKTCAFPVRLEIEPRKGLSAARNCGVSLATGALLVFTDDDCRLDLDYVRDAIRHDAADTSPVLRGGRVELGNPNDLQLTINPETTCQRWSRAQRSARETDISKSILGCNMALRRSAAQFLGPFDERLGAGAAIPAGEDADYINRAYLGGMLIEHVGDMVSTHYHGRQTIEEGRRLLHNYAQGDGALYVKYLRRDIDLCRPFVWDGRQALKEILSGKRNFLPALGFSYRRLLVFRLIGAVKFLLAGPDPAKHRAACP